MNYARGKTELYFCLSMKNGYKNYCHMKWQSKSIQPKHIGENVLEICYAVSE